jgi:NTE family protein
VSRWREVVEEPLLAFTGRNIRTGPLLKRFLLPWNWFRSRTVVEALAQRYEKDLTDLRLASLPETPEFVLCATDMAFGVNWEFKRQEVGDYQLGHVRTPGDWPLAKAVGASSCFPPVFDPMPIPAREMDFQGGWARREAPAAWQEAIGDLRLTDGGNYDNMGLEPVWKDHAVVIVSDAGGLFDLHSDKNLIWRIQRYVSIQENQARSLRKRWLVSNFIAGKLDGAYFGIGSARSRYEETDALGYPKDLAKEVIAKIRTDLDAFSPVEAAILMNHGYLLADKAVRTHLDERYRDASAPEPQPPHPEWLPPAKTAQDIREALAGSEKRKKLGRR